MRLIRVYTRKPATRTTWRTLLQSPYDASIPLSTVQYKVANEWENVLLDLSVTEIYQAEGIELDQLFAEAQQDKQLDCILYRCSYRENFKSGLWEIELYTTRKIGRAHV